MPESRQVRGQTLYEQRPGVWTNEVPTGTSSPSLPATRGSEATVLPPIETGPRAPEFRQPDTSALMNLIPQLQAAAKQPIVSTSTQTTKGERSPELEQAFQETINRLNALSAETRDAYGGYSDIFNRLARELAGRTQTEASRVPRAVGTAALTSGLTPLEAASASGQERSRILQEFFPQEAQLRAQQAQVPVQLSEALLRMEEPYQRFLETTSDYQRGLAGTTTTGRTETSVNPIEVIRATGDIFAAVDAMQRGWASVAQDAYKLDQTDRQMMIDKKLGEDQIAFREWEVQQKEQGADRRHTEDIVARAELMDKQIAAELEDSASQRDFITSEREEGQEFEAGETEKGRAFVAERDQAAWEQSLGGPAPDDWASLVSSFDAMGEEGEPAPTAEGTPTAAGAPPTTPAPATIPATAAIPGLDVSRAIGTSLTPGFVMPPMGTVSGDIGTVLGDIGTVSGDIGPLTPPIPTGGGYIESGGKRIYI